MKLTKVVLVALVTFALASCGSRFNNPEELTVPVIHGIQAESIDKLSCLLPSIKDVNGALNANVAEAGGTYFNKYTKSYRIEYLVAHINSNLDIIKTISKANNLDWSTAEYTKPERADATDDGTSYATISTTIHFEKGGDYDLKFKAVNYNSKWFLFDDIWFAKSAKK
jgi:hypothetical protein